MTRTKINYGHYAVNPLSGCARVSPGCLYCYAELLSATRLKHHPHFAGVAQLKKSGEAAWTGLVNWNEYAMRGLSPRQKPSRILWNFLSDWMHPSVKDEWIELMLAVMAATPNHTHITLTKRPERLTRFHFPDNCWVGVTAENQAMVDARIPTLLQTLAALRIVSVEPMLEEIDMRYPGSTTMSLLKMMDGRRLIDGIVIGCESGPRRRPCRIENVESLVEQCRVAGVPVWVKQIEVNGRVTGRVEEFPPHLQIRELPK